MMIAAGYEDGNDASSLRVDPAFKLAQDRLPSGRDLASQPTISRLENLPDLRSLPRMGQALVDLYCKLERVERIIARVEVGDQGADTRYITTNLEGGRAKALYEKIYCRRGAAENHINPGRRISPPIVRHAPRRPPTSSGCSCMPALTG
jgi:hypothetical protein